MAEADISSLRDARSKSRSAQIRKELGYPVIDTDYHTNEFQPVLYDYIDKFGGAKLVDKFRGLINKGYVLGRQDWYGESPEERLRNRTARPPWWSLPAKRTEDYLAVSIPSLLHERLGESGTDFAILYPNISMFAILLPDAESRTQLSRAINTYHADIFRPYSDRITPVASVPLHTPEEGIAELEYAVNVLGLKTLVIPGAIRRPIPALAEKYPPSEHPQIAGHTTWLDTFGLDSIHDYDPFWAKVVELGVAPTTHTGGMGWTARSSISNYMYNHIGHFADASHAFAKSLFLGGVTRRFPQLRFGFLEGGAGWGTQLYADLVGHWEKRGYPQILHYDPASLDRDTIIARYREHGKALWGDRSFTDDELYEAALDIGLAGVNKPQPAGTLDDFAAADIKSVEDIRDHFVPNFYFGAEADDPTVAYAFNTKINPLGAQINAFWATDSGHWDVPELSDTLAQTWALVERGALTKEQFKALVFDNPYRFYTDVNPDFFKGTAVESALAVPERLAS
jgi:predicted TIM-barrel fold metal-dependent hydrolase